MTVQAQLADGRTLEFPDGTDPSVVQATVKKLLAGNQSPREDATSAKNLAGAAIEPNLSLLSGAAATPLSGLAGIAGTLLPGAPGQGARWVHGVQDALTYRPRTEGGKVATEAITYPLEKIGEGADYVGQKVTDVTGSPTAGALSNAALQAGVPLGLGKLAPRATTVAPAPLRVAGDVAYRAIEPMLPNGPADILRRYQRDLTGDAKGQVVDALLKAKQLVPGSAPTAGEAIAAIPEASPLAAHQAAIARTPEVSGSFVRRAADQQEARADALSSIAQTPDALAAARAERESNAQAAYGPILDRRISPKSDVELMQEAIANRAASKAFALQDKGRFQTLAAENETRANDFVPVPGMPRVAARVSEFPERVAEAQSAATDADSVRAQRLKEQKYLESTMELLRETVGLDDKSLTPLLGRPSMQAAVQDAMRGAQETGAYFPVESGDKFSLGNLQRIKQSLDDAVKDPASFGIKATEAKEIMGTRDAFVKWLSNKSPEWRDARLQYAQDSRPINQMEVGQYLEKKLRSPLDDRERAGVFAQAAQDAPGTIKRSTGGPRFDDLSDVLTPKQTDVVQAIQDDLSRKAQYDALSKGTTLSSPTNVAGGAGVTLPHMLSRPASIANWLMRAADEGADTKVNRLAGKQYLNPELLAKSLGEKTTQERIVAELLRRRNQAVLGGVAAGSERQGAQ